MITVTKSEFQIEIKELTITISKKDFWDIFWENEGLNPKKKLDQRISSFKFNNDMSLKW